jgi:hypothetical protein
MPTIFETPASRPTSIGDGYTLYKQSVIPVVPVVDSVVVEEGEVVEPLADKQDDIEIKVESDELNGKRKTSPTEEGSSESETPDTKRTKQETDGREGDGEGGDPVENTTTSTGSEVAAVPSESDGDEPKDGDKGISVPAEPERDHPEQATEEEGGGGKL